MRLYLIILLLALTFITSIGYTNYRNPYFNFSNKSKVEKFKNGYIDWTRGFFLANSRGQLPGRLTNAPNNRLNLERKLAEQAKQNLLNMILATKVDSYHYVRDYFNDNEDFRASFFEKISNNLIVLPPAYLGGGAVEIVVKYPIYGRGSLCEMIFQLDNNVTQFPNFEKDYSDEPIAYSSIIIDLRGKYMFRLVVEERLDELPDGIQFPVYLQKKIWYDKNTNRLKFKGVMTESEKNVLLRLSYNRHYRDAIQELFLKSKQSNYSAKYSPSLFPKIYDSTGILLYSKNMIEYQLRKNFVYTKYTRDNLLRYKVEVVGQNPLYILADKIKGENNSDIIINRADAKQIFRHPITVNNLKRGKIYILVD